MKKASFALIVMLLAGIISMVNVIPTDAASTRFYVDPVNTIDSTLQAESPVTIKPMQDGTYKDWTWDTTTLRPDQDGAYSDWTGRILTLNPNGHGTFGAWDSWVHITPNVNGIHTNWTGTIADWDDWPTNDGDSTVRTASFNNYNESSGFWDPPLEPRTLSIDKVRLTIVARQTNGTYPEQIRLMLVLGGSMYNGSLVTPGTSYSTFTSEWATNPRTTSAWLWSEIDSLEAGVRSQRVGPTFDSQLRVTQIFVSILTGGVYTQWADWPANNTDTDYIFAASDVGGQSSALPNHTTENWSILKVRVTVVARADITTDDTMAIMVVVNGKSYNSTYFTPATSLSYAEYSYEWSMNPRWPTLPWNWTAIDALEVGVNTKQVKSSWAGEFRVTQIYVKVIEAGSYSLWNEAAPDGDASYVSTFQNAKYRSSQLQNHTSESWSISRLQVSIVARTDIPTDEKLQIMIVIGGRMYNSTSFLPTTTNATYSYVWLKNPRYPTLSWNWTAIDGLEAGVKSVQTGTQWTGELRVTQLYVVVGRSGTFTEWDDWPDQNGDSDYVSATANLMKESSQLENPVHPSWTIGRVRVVIYARATLTTDEQVCPMVVVAGLEFLGPPNNLNTTYTKYIADWGKNPLTQSRWTWTDIDALEAGAQGTIGNDKIWTGEIRITQMYVEVTALKFSVNISVENVVDLYTADFRLNYTTAILSVATVSPGSFWSPYTPKVWIEDVNDVLGSVRYMISMPIGSVQGKNGTGPVATIDFIVDSYGFSNLTLAKVELFGRGGVPITSFDVYDGYFRNTIPGDVNGDRIVNVVDAASVSAHWYPGPPIGPLGYGREADINSDGLVNVLDGALVSANWNKVAP